MTREEVILTERRDNILVITINRPDVRNAFDFETADAMSRAIDELDGDDELRVGIVTGAGGHFSAGMDLKAFEHGDVPYVERRGVFGIINGPPETPLIAAVEGGALAGGFELMLACDMVVASSEAEFGIPEVRRGLLAASGALLDLPRLMPLPIATELALTGTPIAAARAAELGLINAVTPPGSALDGALELAETIAANAPLAVAASKRILKETWGWTESERWEEQGRIAGPVLTSEDAREGARSFLERRDPVWRGR